ncbi:MAG: GDSL-type esterase/lipase family protein [Rhodobacteraceae bacterium]|jgi:acyl-CoA thioesterase I|nr:GDSL-type esterase/lipase family protein [Paracoccaceae bacterium]
MKFSSFSARFTGYGAFASIRNGLFAFILSLSAAAAEPVTIVALGDSLTAGYGLPEGDGFVPQMQAWLAATGADAVVLNAGVSGDTTAGGASRLDWALTDEVDALIVNLGGNDMLRGIDPAEARGNLTTIMEGAKARGLPVLLVGLRAPGNYGAEYKAAFDAIYPELAERYGAGLVADYLAPVVTPDGTQLDPALMQADGIHPNKAGVAAAVAALGPAVIDLIGRVGG